MLICEKFMTSKFDSVPVDDNTKILAQVETKLCGYEILYQKWVWNGIIAESIIFTSDEISGLNDHDLENLVRKSPLVNQDTKITISKVDSQFTLVNFNFKTI